ncbi:MAG: aminodeoxychorismate lyase [Gammaproteobacteria bacterium]
MANIALYNGHPETHTLIQNRGLAYGDGLFETIACIDGEMRHWDAHVRRLLSGCNRLRIPPPDTKQLSAEAKSLVGARDRAVVKIILTRGPGGRGYAPPANVRCERIVQILDWPSGSANWHSRGVRVGICATELSKNQLLAGIKHLNRLEQVLAADECAANDWEEGLMMTTDHNVVCGTKTNVFLVAQRRLFTPDLTECGVLGTMRARVLEQTSAHRIPVTECAISIDTLANAEYVFLTNALVGLAPVASIEFPDGHTKTIDFGSSELITMLQSAVAD